MSIITPEGLIPVVLDPISIDGNVMSIIGTIARDLKRAGNSREVIDAFRSEAMSGDYDHVLQTVLAYTS